MKRQQEKLFIYLLATLKLTHIAAAFGEKLKDS